MSDHTDYSKHSDAELRDGIAATEEQDDRIATESSDDALAAEREQRRAMDAELERRSQS